MKKIVWNQLNEAERRAVLLPPSTEPGKDKEDAVRAIMDEVRRNGDRALRRYSMQFDGFDPDPVFVPASAIEDSENKIDTALREAMREAYTNITAFHKQQGFPSFSIETLPGIVCERRTMPLERVGIYIPGGTAPLFSTALMLGVASQIAGNPVRIACTPANAKGDVHPAILYAAKLSGLTQVARLGGAQAIAALAFGTESIPAVGKILGPGNIYVTLAKTFAAAMPGGPAIDMPAGPSEVLVIVDEKTPDAFAAADLLAQAEHDALAQVVLIAPGMAKIDAILEESQRQLETLPRRAMAQQAMAKSLAIVAESMDQAMAISNLYAPEHLILGIEDYAPYLEQVTNAGSVFCGLLTPESFGDYASGTNNVLPTGAAPRAWSGLTVEAFQKTITVQHASRDGFERLAGTVVAMAQAEGLEGHARAVTVRQKGG